MDVSVASSQAGANDEELSQALKEGVEIKDRKWHTKTYKNCFLHSDAVNWMMTKQRMTEEMAVATLNELRLAGYIQHVVDLHKAFRPGITKKLYFCFLDDELSHVIQKQKAAAKKALKQNKLNPQMLKEMLTECDEFIALQTKISRMEKTLNKSSENERITQSKLEIVHQATISLIQAMVATAFLLMVLLAYTLYIIVPSMHQTTRLRLITSIFGTSLIAAFVYRGMNLFQVWLQLDSSLVQVAEGVDAVEDYEVETMSVSTTSNKTGLPMPPIPLRAGLQRRKSSLYLKQPLLVRSPSQLSSSKIRMQQRQPVDLPHPSQWPHRPVLVCANTPVDPSLQVPIYGDSPCPIGKPFHFSSDLFEGTFLIRLRNLPNSDDPANDRAYFDGRRRLFQTIIQGRFKQSLGLHQVLTGHEFVKPLQNLPHPWILKAATNVIGNLAPGAQIRVAGGQPLMLAPLAATSQTVRGDEPGNEPDITSLEDLQEDCSPLGGKFSSGKVSASGRKLHLANPTRAAEYRFDTETVYTFDFYQSLLNCVTYSLDLGVANIGMAPVLNGQPIQSLCKTADGRYLWSFQIWHESLLPPSAKPEESSKRKTN